MASRSETVLVAAARVLLAAGREADARQLAAELSGQTQGYSRAYTGIIQGEQIGRQAFAQYLQPYRP